MSELFKAGTGFWSIGANATQTCSTAAPLITVSVLPMPRSIKPERL
jgi:hypothetical protein